MPIRLAIALLTLATCANAADEKPAFAGPPAAEQLKILQPLVGKWKSQSTVKPNIRLKEGYVANGEYTTQWIHNGHFLESRGFMTNPNGRYEISAIVGFDRQTGALRRFAFDSNGLIIDAQGEWDPATRTFTWKTQNAPPGWTSVAIMKIESDDKITFTGIAKNEKGEIVNEFVNTAQRDK